MCVCVLKQGGGNKTQLHDYSSQLLIIVGKRKRNACEGCDEVKVEQLLNIGEKLEFQ